MLHLVCKELKAGTPNAGVGDVAGCPLCLPGQSLSSGGAEAFSSVLEENFLVRFEESLEMLPIYAIYRNSTFY